MSSPDNSVFGSTQNGEEEDGGGEANDNTTLSFSDSDFFLNLDDVEIGPQIGVGAFSKVYLGRYLGELVAVKKQARNEADLEAYLMRELAVLKHYQHENLLQYIGASNATASEPGGLSHVFIVTELACGGDLLALLLSEGEVGWKLRVSILTDAARALEFLHRKSLIHRDIKSPNILLDSNMRCKIADFGMARQLGTNMTVVGTDAYMAPELMFDDPYGTSADMFSFGIVLWETIYRQKAGADEFMERRMSDRFELDVQGLQDDAPTDANVSLVALARELVESKPDLRPTAEDTLLWLEDLTDELPDDKASPREPIDYESLFRSSVTDLESHQRRPAEVRELPGNAIPKATTGTAGHIKSTHLGGGRGGGGGADQGGLRTESLNSKSPTVTVPAAESAPARARGENSPLPPGVPKDAAFMARRATMDTGPQKHRQAEGVKRTISLQAGLKHGREGGGGADGAGAGSVGTQLDGGGGAGVGAGGLGRTTQLHRNSIGLSPTSSAGLTAGPSGSLGGTGRHSLSATSSVHNRAIGAAHAPITRQGYLYKKGKSGLKNWQKRWFVLEGSKLIWYKDSKAYPREPRGYLELKGCFLVRGEYLRWKILSADASAEQDDYNRAIAAKEEDDMESWLKSLQEAIDGADTGEGPAGVKLPVLNRDGEAVDATLFNGTKGGYRTDMSVEAWLESLGLGQLSEAFFGAGYTDFLMIQEMGLTDEDLAFIGVRNAAQRRALKMGARGFVELMLQVEISAFFNFHSELVYRLDSRWRYLRATTFFEFSDFEDLHRRLKAAMKDTKFQKMMPSLPQRPADPRGRRLGSIDHARQMAKVQQELNRYTQKLVMLVGTKEPYFTVLCGMLDLLPPDPNRLPFKSDEFLSQMQSRLIEPGTLGSRSLGRARTDDGESFAAVGTALPPPATAPPLVSTRGAGSGVAARLDGPTPTSLSSTRSFRSSSKGNKHQAFKLTKASSSSSSLLSKSPSFNRPASGLPPPGRVAGGGGGSSPAVSGETR